MTGIRKATNFEERVTDPGKKHEQGLVDEAPALEEPDREAIESGDLERACLPENGDLRYPDDPSSELSEEDDHDNAYQNSDEALPVDREEAAITRDPSREHNR